MPFLGETIAIGTVLCWTISVQFFEAATKRAGSTPVNIIRIGIAVLFFAVFLQFRSGQPIPLDFPVRAWLLLSLSGVGLVIIEKNGTRPLSGKRQPRQITLIGIGYGLLAMVGQAVGMVLSKAGMQQDDLYLDAFAATEIRALAAFICFVLFFSVTGRWGNVRRAVEDRHALLMTTLGAFT